MLITSVPTSLGCYEKISVIHFLVFFPLFLFHNYAYMCCMLFRHSVMSNWTRYEEMQGLRSSNLFLKTPNYLKTCPIRSPGAQTASLHPELPRGCWRSTAIAAQGSISMEADGKGLVQSLAVLLTSANLYLTRLYKVHVYNILFQLLYTLQCAHHQVFSFYLSPYCWPLYPFCLPLYPIFLW